MRIIVLFCVALTIYSQEIIVNSYPKEWNNSIPICEIDLAYGKQIKELVDNAQKLILPEGYNAGKVKDIVSEFGSIIVDKSWKKKTGILATEKCERGIILVYKNGGIFEISIVTDISLGSKKTVLVNGYLK